MPVVYGTWSTETIAKKKLAEMVKIIPPESCINLNNDNPEHHDFISNPWHQQIIDATLESGVPLRVEEEKVLAQLFEIPEVEIVDYKDNFFME